MTKESILTIDIGASKVLFQAVGMNGELGPSTSVKLVELELNNDKLLGLLEEGIRPFVESGKDSKIVSISIGCPGPLNPITSTIETPPNLKGVENLNIGKRLKDIFNLPVYLLNDAAAAGIGECWLGAGKGFSSVIYITLSSGLGCANLVNGMPVWGMGKAPEWGHTPMHIQNHDLLFSNSDLAHNRLCSCKKYGCVEAYLGTRGLARTYSDIFEIGLIEMTDSDIYDISPKMRAGVQAKEPKYQKLQKKYSLHLASLLSNIILVHQPEIIILGGGIAYNNEPLLAETIQHLDGLMAPGSSKVAIMRTGVKISLAQFENPVNLGAAKYAIDKLAEAK